MNGLDLRRQIRAVRSLVAPYSHHREITDDLEQAGHLGYVAASRDPRYDPDLASIETWAYRGARNAITAEYRAELRHHARVGRARRLSLSHCRVRARGYEMNPRRPRTRGRREGLDHLDRLAVREAVAMLPNAECNMVVAWFWLDIPPKEYARLCGLSEWAGRNHRDRAVAKLCESLKPED